MVTLTIIDPVNTKDRNKQLENAEKNIHAPRLRTVNIVVVALATILAIVAGVTLTQLFVALQDEEAAHAKFDACTAAASQLMEASDDLTRDSLLYVATGDSKFLDAYLDEIESARRRDKAIATIEQQSGGSEAANALIKALENSNQLAEYELYAMRLTAEASGLSPMPDALMSVNVSSDDASLSNEAKSEVAKTMLLGSAYTALKHPIETSVDECTQELMQTLSDDETHYEKVIEGLLARLFVSVAMLLLVVLVAAIANWRLVMRPMIRHRKNIKDNELLEPIGSFEMQRVVYAYNMIYDENHRRTLLLEHEAQTDALTGLLNRGSYEKLLARHTSHVGLAIIDLDLFKEVNDNYGHKVGDEILKKVAVAIAYHFRTTDYACRIGGDEFAVVMTEVNESHREVIATKLDAIADKLEDTSDGLPAVTCSTGIAFTDVNVKVNDLYEVADKALYAAKHAGRARYAFADETSIQ